MSHQPILIFAQFINQTDFLSTLCDLKKSLNLSYWNENFKSWSVFLQIRLATSTHSQYLQMMVPCVCAHMHKQSNVICQWNLTIKFKQSHLGV